MRFRSFLRAILMFAVVASLIGNIETAIGAESYEADVVKVRALFENRQFSDLTSLIEKYHRSSEQDLQWEFSVLDSFNVFNTSKSNYRSLLDEWVQSTPKTWIPLLARATYFDGLGWRARGTRWAKDTSEGQFRLMADNFGLATQDIKTATQINPRVWYAFYLLIKMNRSTGNQQVGNLLAKKALEIAPGSYLIQRQHMQLLLPRWGGSHEAMEQLAQEATTYVEKNRPLKSLLGMVSWDQAGAERSDKNYARAIELYNKSLSYGETWNTLYDLAKTYNRNNMDVEALHTIDNAIALFQRLPDRYILSAPDLFDAYILRSRAYMAQNRLEEALKDLERIEEVGSRFEEIDQLRQWAGNRLMSEGHALIKTDLSRAIDKYTLSLRFYPKNAEANCWRGVANNRIGGKDAALSDLQKAISLNPRLYRAYVEMDSVLFKQGRLDEIIELWTQFLALEPKNADAYLERSGTYYHKKDFAASLRDAAKACEFGNTKACQKMNSIPK